MSDRTDRENELLTLMHVAVEHALIELRDARIFVIGPANGLVVREKDGTDSGIMRMGTRDAMRVALHALIAAGVGINARAVPPTTGTASDDNA